MSRNYNFCAGPAALPNEVLEQLREEIPDWKGKGLSVMAVSYTHLTLPTTLTV